MTTTRTLTLTSPLTTGADVKVAQEKLISGTFLREGRADGQFGPETARACQTAHWLLGFPGKLAMAATYGELLDNVLTEWIADGALPAAYRKRRNQRLKAAASKSLGEKALDWLRPHVGDTEKPAGSNHVPWATDWYGITGPWCAMAATRAFVEAGSKAFVRGQRWAYVPFIVHDATHALNGLRRTFAPVRGSLVCFDWTGDGVFDHVEIVDNPPTSLSAGAAFTTIGGNTSFDDGGDQSNGGACAHRNRTVLSGGRVVFVEVLR